MHDDLMDRCNKVGCRMSDFVKASVEFCLYGCVEFDFGDVWNDGNDDKPKEPSTSDNVPKVKVHLD